MKLELAIIENLQREDLNPIDRAKAFKQLADEFNLKHLEIAQRVGKSREYVSNTLRILLLPENMQQALSDGDINEGHTRPLLMLSDKPEEQATLFHEIVTRRLTVRDSEQLARRVAIDRVRKVDQLPPDILIMERELTERLGTRVRIEKNKQGGKVMIDFFSEEDLAHLLAKLREQEAARAALGMTESSTLSPEGLASPVEPIDVPIAVQAQPEEPQEDIYSVRNFSV
jgi:ParB family chromosome partitioning protein